MSTQYINEKNKLKNKPILMSIKYLIDNRIIAFPTETVYGLGANAESTEAILKVFKAKGRPINNPLIVHISSIFAIKYWSVCIPRLAYEISSKFWPGPITLVLKKKKK